MQMKRNTISTAAIVAAMIFMASPTMAEDEAGLNVDLSATGKAGGVAQFGLSHRLYATGMELKDPLLVLTAAKLAAGVELIDTKLEKTTQPGTAEQEPDAAEGPVDVARMLSDARELAGDDEVLLGLIEDVEATGSRGRIGGASREVSRLSAGAVDTWKVPFFGGSYAEVGITGDGDAPLDVVIADEAGNRLSCKSTWDQSYCDFVPKRNGYFTVTVANNGRKQNSYFMLTN